MAIRARRRLVDYYRTRAVRMLPDPRPLHGTDSSTGLAAEASRQFSFPVRDLDAAEPCGTWGGLTPLERALLTPHSTDRAAPTRRDHRRSTPKPIHRRGGALRY